MRIRFWSSVEGTAFMQGLMRELTEVGFDAKQCYQISEASYRSAKSAPARLFLRFRQYVLYPMMLCIRLLGRGIRNYQLSIRNQKSDQGSLDSPSPISHQPLPASLDVCVVCTNTFYAPLLATYLHPNVVHLVYDLFPEAMIHSGKWTAPKGIIKGTLKVRIVRWITKQTLKRAKTNVFLGERLKDYVESIHGPVANSAIIAVGADQALFGLSPKERLGKADAARQCGDGEPKVCPEGVNETGAPRAEKEQTLGSEGGDHPDLASKSPLLEKEGSCQEPSNLNTLPLSDSEPKAQPTILYCGNFGNMHDSATLFEYWRQVAESGKLEVGSEKQAESLLTPHSSPFTKTTWLFSCSGPKRAELEAVLSELPDDLQQQIELGGGLDQAAWIATMESADVALVTMVPGSETVVMPSKTYSAMMAGQAILAIAPEDSDLVDLIKAAECGWWVAPGDVAGLAAVIDTLSADPEGLLEKRERSYHYAHAHLGQDALAKQWLEVLTAT